MDRRVSYTQLSARQTMMLFSYVRNLLAGVEMRAPVVHSPGDGLMVGDIRRTPDSKLRFYRYKSVVAIDPLKGG